MFLYISMSCHFLSIFIYRSWSRLEALLYGARTPEIQYCVGSTPFLTDWECAWTGWEGEGALAPKLIHEAFCEPIRKKPPLATHRQGARKLIHDHRKRGEISHKKDMIEFCKSLGLNQQGGHALSQFPTFRLDDFYKWRSTNRGSLFQTRPLISAHMKWNEIQSRI